jgi:MFS family permease
LYIRLRLTETAAFRRAIENNERVRLPMLTVCAAYKRALILGTFAATATFVLFYLMTVFALSWGTRALGYARTDFLMLQMFGVLFLAITIPVSAAIADRLGCRPVLLVATAAIGAFGLVFAPLFGSGHILGVGMFMALGLALMGFTYGPLGTALAQLFPTTVRYTGASLAFNLAGILGASLAPYIATSLALHYGLACVGFYLSAAALLTFVAVWHKHPGPHVASAAAAL